MWTLHIDFLLTFREFEYPIAEVAENSGVGLNTIHSLWSRLVELGMIIQTHQEGGAKVYELNISNPVVQELMRLDDAITKQCTGMMLKEEEKVQKMPE